MAVVNSFAKFASATYPNVADVATGVAYGDSNNSFTGTLNIDTAANAPNVDNVRLGVVFGSLSQFTGTVVLPATGDVRSGTTYGANATEYTGTMASGSNVTVPPITDVLNGVVYGDPALPVTGNVVLPATDVVKAGEQYGAAGTAYTGTYVASNTQYVVQTGNKQLTRGDDVTLAWESDGTWSATGSILFGIVGLTGTLQVAGVVVDSSNVKATLTTAQTDALRGTYEYDVQMTDASGNVSHLVRGELFVANTETDIPTNTPLPAARPI
tara:strand:+ start:300 stop:1106 length:807 start_codon:yes stop_codon:yes gene_type:complete